MSSGRPLAGEFGVHAEDDIARVAGDDAVEALSRQEREVEELIRGLDERAIAGKRYAPDKWTVKEIIGHMSVDEKGYVAGANFEERSLDSLLEEYRLIRASTIALLQSLSPEAWHRRGTAAGYTASVRGLAWHIAGHELHHL